MAKKQNNLTKGELSQASLEFLGLSKQPFAAEILSEKTFFRNQALDKIVENLIHQIQFSELLLIVEGIQGSGKTSLFRHFIQQDISNTKILSVQAEATDTLIQIQQKISLHLEDLGDANHLDDNLKSLQTFDQTPVLVMDNSHVLSDTTLQELFRYQQEIKQELDVTLKVLLFANSGMSSTLQKITDIQADQMYVQSMPEYSPKQVENFLFFKLRNADYSGEPLFDEKTLQALYKKSAPSLQGYMNNAAPIIDRIVERKLRPGPSIWMKLLFVLLFITLLAVAGVAYFFYSSKDTLTTELQTPTATAVTPSPLYLEDTADTYTPAAQDTGIGDSTTTEATQDTAAEVEPVTPEPIENEQITALDEPAETAALDIEEQQPAEAVSSIAETVESIEPTAAPTVKAETIDATAPAVIQKPAPSPVVTPQAPKVKASEISHPALKQLAIMGVADAGWITQQAASNYTLQLIGARDPETLLKFARRYSLGKNTAWYKTWLKAKPYYVLIHGSYSDRDSARNAINSLSPALRSVKPWIKSMSAVQQAVK